MRRIVIRLLLLVALAILVYGGTRKADAPLDASRLDPAVEALVPVQDSAANIRQAEIGIDLAPGWTGDLRINGHDIPEDQLRRNEPLNQFFFQPGRGKEIGSLPPGNVTVTAIIWQPLAGQSRTSGSHSITWSFTVA
ncbi:MAG: hypothetical protein JF603_13220 [Acidobacteria bacterium]|nr:hypothetical protein [Acidobacteriota bacterium]